MSEPAPEPEVILDMSQQAMTRMLMDKMWKSSPPLPDDFKDNYQSWLEDNVWDYYN